MSAPPLEAKQRLLMAAIQEFALHGYDHGTVRRICGRADVNVNAVKYYFTDKRGLYVEAVKEAHRSRHQKLVSTSFIPPGDEPGLDPEVRLKAFIFQMVKMAMDAQDRSDFRHLLIFRELANPSEATQHIVQEFIRPHFERINQILEQLLPPETPKVDRQLLAFSTVGQCMHYKMAGPIIGMLISEEEYQQLSVERVADHIYSVILASIQQKSRSGTA